MSAAYEGAAYVYQNVGVPQATPTQAYEGAAYVYQNIGLQARSRLGAVYGMSGPHLTPFAYVYQNITT